MRRPWLLLIALAMAGCRLPPVPPRTAYTGPTDPMPTVVRDINNRYGPIVTLRGEGSFAADLIDPKTQKHTTGDGDIILMYAPPGNMRLVAKVLTERVFEAGANDRNYWLIDPKNDRLYVGTRDAAQTGHAAELPIRPDLLPEVLGITPLDRNLLNEPVPTMRFESDVDCYVLSFQTTQPGYLALQKEVWYDRKSLLPVRVRLFDDKGRVVLRAELSDPKPIDGYDPPMTVPARYDLWFPESGSTFSIRLSQLANQQNGVPNSRTFLLPTPQKAGVSQLESLDR